jgi:hypothetical protein
MDLKIKTTKTQFYLTLYYFERFFILNTFLIIYDVNMN